MKNFTVIVAAAVKTLGIGRGGAIPWKISEDVRYFKKVTSQCRPNTQNAIIMGRKTWESIPPKFRPFSDRLNIVLTRNPNARTDLSLPDDVQVYGSLAEALLSLASPDVMTPIDNVFVIGGEAVYREAMELPQCTKILFTAVESDVEDCDTFFPPISALKYQLTYRGPVKQDPTNNLSYRFCEYSALTDDEIHLSSPMGCDNSEEMQYLNACRDILSHGVVRGDRTGTGTISKFGLQMRFSLRNNIFPLLTTKRVFWRGVAEELLWFVAGCTDANQLAAKNIHIWDDNGSREFLDSRGLSHREVGDLGPVYGFQWRHFGAEYTNMHADYSNKGIDQLKECIDKIKNSPEDRRIILTAWNPADLHLMALPPCHMFCQFYVANGELSCQMYQRSADMGLGVPFNIASYSLLTRMMAQVCGLTAGDFVHTIGDAHIYLNHVDAIKEQLTRVPKSFPTLTINPDKKDIDSFEYSDFTIEGYTPDAAIKMKMAV